MDQVLSKMHVKKTGMSCQLKMPEVSSMERTIGPEQIRLAFQPLINDVSIEDEVSVQITSFVQNIPNQNSPVLYDLACIVHAVQAGQCSC